MEDAYGCVRLDADVAHRWRCCRADAINFFFLLVVVLYCELEEHGGGVLCSSKSSKLLVCAQFVYTNAEALNHM